MASDDVRRIADAVLYEGYLLWPYRKSAMKNQQRFTFGGVYPPRWDDFSSIQAQVLLEGDEDARIEARVRFLQVVRRQVLRIDRRTGRQEPEPVEELVSGGERFVSWDEALEREFAPGPIRVRAGERVQQISGGAIRRSWRTLEGELSLVREELRPGLSRVTATLLNAALWEGEGREDALRQTFCSAHMVLRTDGGAWVSATDPPPRLQAAADTCENVGVWPVLLGEPGERATMLASAIILSDHPEIAPESPGDLFDSGEIDQMLVLNILSMTDEERRDMRDSDPRAREILERTESLSEAEITRLNGAVRDFGMVRPR